MKTFRISRNRILWLIYLGTSLGSASALGQAEPEARWLESIVPMILAPPTPSQNACTDASGWMTTECHAFEMLRGSSAAGYEEQIKNWLDGGDSVMILFRDRHFKGGFWVFGSWHNSITSNNDPIDDFGKSWDPDSEESILFFGRGGDTVRVFADPEWDGPSVSLCGTSAIGITENFKPEYDLGQNAINSFKFEGAAGRIPAFHWREPPTVSLSADPTSASNGATTLTWSSKNASSCNAYSGWFGAKSTSGSTTIRNLTANNTFKLCCSGPGGSATGSVSVVGPPPTPTVSLSADPVSVSHHGSTTLTWSSKNASSCSASGGWSGPRSIDGSTTIRNLTANTTFSISCSGPGGTVRESIGVKVRPRSETGVLSGRLGLCTLGATSATLSVSGTVIDATGTSGRISFQHTKEASLKPGSGGYARPLCAKNVIDFKMEKELMKGTWHITAGTDWGSQTCKAYVPGDVTIDTINEKCTVMRGGRR